jgi:hypothetical protein
MALKVVTVIPCLMEKHVNTLSQNIAVLHLWLGHPPPFFKGIHLFVPCVVALTRILTVSFNVNHPILVKVHLNVRAVDPTEWPRKTILEKEHSVVHDVLLQRALVVVPLPLKTSVSRFASQRINKRSGVTNAHPKMTAFLPMSTNANVSKRQASFMLAKIVRSVESEHQNFGLACGKIKRMNEAIKSFSKAPKDAILFP